jgi:hypothetical protein
MNRRASWQPAALASVIPLIAATMACGRHQTVASRSAAAYDEAQRRGIPIQRGEGHGAHGPASDDQGHGPEATAAPNDPGAGHGPPDTSHGHPPSSGQAKHPAPGPGGMSATDHPRATGSAASGHGAHSAPGPGAPPSKPGEPHAGAMSPPPSEKPAAMAPAGSPSATLRPDELDQPASTSLLDAERSGAMAREMSGGHGMPHGTPYQQMDAGRDNPAPAAAPGGHEHNQQQPPPTRATPKPDPHQGHGMPSPRPTPTPRPSPSPHGKENHR